MTALHNYLVTALRVLAANRLYSSINIIGLAAGLACCLLVFLFVREELSYDRWLRDAERIYRLDATFFVPGREPLAIAQSPGPARDALLKDFPEDIEHAVRLVEFRYTMTQGDRQFSEVVVESDPGFFEVFDLPFLEGDPATALQDNSSLVLTESMARKFFGDEPAMGRTLTLTRREPQEYRVTGIIRDLPRNTHLELGFIARFDPAKYAEKEEYIAEEWTSANLYTYVKFRSQEAADRVAAVMPQFIDRNVNFDIPDLESIRPSSVLRFDLIPVPRIHLYATTEGGFRPPGDIHTVVAFAAVAVLILVIACINFMNLATARSLQRAREVAIRKVVGAHRRQLIAQFLGESLLTTVLAMVIACVAAWAALPWFNGLIDKELTFELFTDPVLPASVVGLALVVGLAGGLYPAFYLSRFHPASVLKAGQAGGVDRSALLRTGLVVVQFAISIGLIASTLVVYGQTHYARTMDPGYSRDQKLVINGIGGERMGPYQDALVQEMAKVPGVLAVARASDGIPQSSSNNTIVTLPDAPSDDLLVIETMTLDYDFLPLLGVRPVAGRLFARDFLGDVMPHDPDAVEGPISAGVILNRQAVKRLGYPDPQSAVGRTFTIPAGENADKRAEMTVVGVVNDLHFRSVHSKVTPMLYFLGDHHKDFYHLILHLGSNDIAATLKAIDETWSRVVPDTPIRRNFVEDEFAELYQAESKRMKIFAALSAFAVFVACLGLFGLASYSADRRTREIGIRKVLGASVADIVKLLLWHFSRPVIVANLIAWPVAWYFANRWLEGYSYRMDLTPTPFAIAGLAALCIAAATVVLHARRVSMTNPVHALRTE